MSEPICPVCGTPMRVYGRGATLRKHGPKWVCPQAEREVVSDDRGHLSRRPDAKHAFTRVWSEWEIEAEHVQYR